MRRAVWTLAVLVCALQSPSASARPHAFLMMGVESAFQHPAPYGEEKTPVVAGLATLPGDRVAVLSGSGRLSVIDAEGRRSPLAQLPAEFDLTPVLDAEADGSLLAIGNSRVWRIDPSGTATPLTPEVVPKQNEENPPFVGDVAAMPGGGFIYTQGVLIRRSLPDGEQVTVAGDGTEGNPVAGRATRSPLAGAVRVAALPDGTVAFSDFDSVWRVDSEGNMRRIAGCARCTTRPQPGRAALASSFENIDGLWALPDGALALQSAEGVFTINGGRLERIVPVGEFFAPNGLPPLWAGGEARRAWVSGVTDLERTSGGEWLIGTYDGLALLTSSTSSSHRLAVAIHTATLATVWRREIRVSATRPAAVQIRVRRGGHTLETVNALVKAGMTTVRLRHRVPPGVADLVLRASAPDGAIARHRLRVLGTRRLPLAIAERSLLTEASVTGGDTATSLRRCHRESTTRVRCTIVEESLDPTRVWGASVSLHPDGWLWTKQRGELFRLELF